MTRTVGSRKAHGLHQRDRMLAEHSFLRLYKIRALPPPLLPPLLPCKRTRMRMMRLPITFVSASGRTARAQAPMLRPRQRLFARVQRALCRNRTKTITAGSKMPHTKRSCSMIFLFSMYPTRHAHSGHNLGGRATTRASARITTCTCKMSTAKSFKNSRDSMRATAGTQTTCIR